MPLGKADLRLVTFGENGNRVLDLLRNFHSGMSQKEVALETGLSIRSVKYLLKKLVVDGLVTELILANDLRKKLYRRVSNGNK